VIGDVSVDSETLFDRFREYQDQAGAAQSFRGAHRGRVCVRVFIRASAHTCMSIYVCTV
jgi:hypothetical protein